MTRTQWAEIMRSARSLADILRLEDEALLPRATPPPPAGKCVLDTKLEQTWPADDVPATTATRKVQRYLAEASSPRELILRLAAACGLTHQGQLRLVAPSMERMRFMKFAAVLPWDHDEVKRLMDRQGAAKSKASNWRRECRGRMGMIHVCMEPGCGHVIDSAAPHFMGEHIKKCHSAPGRDCE